MAHDRVIIKDSRSAELAGENATLVRKIDACGINQVDNRNARAHRDLLGAEDLLYSLGPPRTGLDSCVIGNDNNLSPADPPDGCYYTGGWSRPIKLIVSDKQPDLLRERALIKKQIYSFTSGELTLFVLPDNFILAATEFDLFLKLV
jgi:hypothetical protein